MFEPSFMSGDGMHEARESKCRWALAFFVVGKLIYGKFEKLHTEAVLLWRVRTESRYMGWTNKTDDSVHLQEVQKDSCIQSRKRNSKDASDARENKLLWCSFLLGR